MGIEERRRNGGLTEEQFTDLKTRLRAELEEELYQKLWDAVALRVGRGILKQGLYVIGACVLAVSAWLHGAGWFKFPGASE